MKLKNVSCSHFDDDGVCDIFFLSFFFFFQADNHINSKLFPHNVHVHTDFVPRVNESL